MKKAVESSVYGSIIRLVTLCENVKLLIATATPMTDHPEQIYSILGMCNHSRNDTLSMNGIISYNSAIRDMPSFAYKGTYEYISEMCVYPSYMQGHQELEYMREYQKQPPDDIYRKLTHISLFCFDDGTHGREVTNVKMSKTRIKTMITSMSTKQTKEIKYIKYDILPHFAHMLEGENLRNCSSKYASTVNLIEQADGNIFIFLEEVKGSGLLLLASVFEQHGYELYLGEDLNNISHGKRYTMCVGSSEICPNNNDRLDGFNSEMNKNGEYVKILLGSKVIGESITLKNVKHFYCLTPHWNDSTVDQAIGRVIRNGSHLDLDAEHRHVDIYIHVSVFKEKPYDSVDLKKLERSKEKEAKIKLVENLMIDCAVDKYINDQSVPITYVTNFAAAYLHHHEETIFALIKKYVFTDDTFALLPHLPKSQLRNEVTLCSKAAQQKIGLLECNENAQERQNCTIVDINDIANILDVDIIICKEVLCRMIQRNVPLIYDTCTRFIRAYENNVYTVDDPSLPYVMVPDAVYKMPNTRNHTEYDIPCVDLTTFRYMPVKRKIMYIEQCVAQGRYEDLSHIDTVYANIDGVICHLLMYRDVESSYSSCSPVPKKPQKKTRMFSDGIWKNIESVEEEQNIFEKYKNLVDSLLNEADHTYPIYGLISTIDGDMRLRLRRMENQDMSHTDTRYVKRGRNMKSIKKTVLIDILSSIGIHVSENMTITEAVKKIDEALVNTHLYIIL